MRRACFPIIRDSELGTNVRLAIQSTGDHLGPASFGDRPKPDLFQRDYVMIEVFPSTLVYGVPWHAPYRKPGFVK